MLCFLYIDSYKFVINIIYLSKLIMNKAVIDVYKDLTNHHLLQRYLQSFTKNSNESVHLQIKVKCPQHLYHGRKKILYVIMNNINIHNFVLFMMKKQFSLQYRKHQDIYRKLHSRTIKTNRIKHHLILPCISQMLFNIGKIYESVYECTYTVVKLHSKFILLLLF